MLLGYKFTVTEVVFPNHGTPAIAIWTGEVPFDTDLGLQHPATALREGILSLVCRH